jgi:nickel-type superoxide dismutase maturation protease
LVTLAFAVVLARCLRRLEVEGESMAPTLLDGDRVLVWRCVPVRPGDVVALVEPSGRTVVKRVVGMGDAGVTVVGDNSELSTDSRHFGPIRPEAIQGRVMWRYWPEERSGWLSLSGTPYHGV